MEEVKKQRGILKASVTRNINKLSRLLAEGDNVACKETVLSLKDAFRLFDVEHQKIIESCGDDLTLIEKEDNYYQLCESSYTAALINYKQSMDNPMVEQQASLSKLLTIPKMDIECYDGQCMGYHSFRAVFNRSIDSVLTNADDKLIHLLRCTTGKAREAISSCSLIGGEAGYQKALKTLENRFGNRHLIADEIRKNLCSSSPVKTAADLRRLADEAETASLVLKSTNLYSELDTQQLICSVVNRLSFSHKSRWRTIAVSKKEETDSYPSFDEFMTFLMRISLEASDPIYGYGTRDVETTSKPRHKAMNYAISTDKGQPVVKHKCMLCPEKHKLFKCPTFKKKSVLQRINIVNENKLCQICFEKGHLADNCTKHFTCKICNEKHSTFLHVSKEPVSHIALKTNETSNSIEQDLGASTNHAINIPSVNCNDISSLKYNTYMPVVKVLLNNDVVVYALLDTASTNSFITKKAMRSLNLKGRSTKFQLSTLVNDENMNTQTVDVMVSSIDCTEHLNMSNVFVIDTIPCNNPCINVSNFSHLRELPLVKFDQSAAIDMLIGQDQSEALVPLSVARGLPGQPFATLTKFGWTLNGRSDTTSTKVVSNFITTQSLDAKVNQLWEIDNQHIGQEKKGWSLDDRRVVEFWQRESHVVDGHLEVPVPWKRDSIESNLPVAICRLKSLQSALKQKSQLEAYDAALSLMLEKNYAERVPPDEIISESSRIWYLPHHPVAKKNGSIRIVFDCASRYRGMSLNDCVYRGPDLNNKLSNVLMRFRLHAFAMCADISSMYNMVRVPKDDRDAIRFIWRRDVELEHYRMSRHIFGGSWCGSCATFALQECVNCTADSSIKNALLNSFYVDDCLISTRTPEEMNSLIVGLRTTLADRGFNLTKFIINNKTLMSGIPEQDRADQTEMFSPEGATKVLGVAWDVQQDSFHFKVDNLEPQESYTKAQMLSIVASIFDPLGFVCPVTIVGMMLFQEANRMKVGWKQKLPSDLNSKWIDWLRTMSQLSTLRVPRCLKPAMFDNSYSELHVFCDASQKAYGCCFYLRCVNEVGQISVTFVCGKSRLAPMKAVSIPRLELQAACLAATMERNLRDEIVDLEICHTTFWSDSRIVLAYIYNTTRRFHVFVSNRISLIHQHSVPSQWRHVPGMENPADILTRGVTASQMPGVWFNGPQFLSTHKSEWQLDDLATAEIPVGDPEVKKCMMTQQIIPATLEHHPVDRLLQYYSDWNKLRRATAWIMKVRLKLLGRDSNAHITASDIALAEKILISHVQHTAYPEEMLMSKDGPLPRNSGIRCLLPRLNDDGILVVSGRLHNSDLPLRQREPVVLPHDSILSSIIVKHFHDQAHHGVEWTLSDLREKFWITRARVLVKRIHKRCLKCKRFFRAVASQKMADLPPERLIAGKPPFHVTGCDCFGPFPVKYKRSTVLRYGCVFTCMNIRAVHIEKLDTLEADSFINGLRRFIARRGCPAVMFSDNATNFSSAVKQLNLAKSEVVQRFSSQNAIEWRFIPPKASHHGGTWERMIRTIRKVATGVLQNNDRMTDEILSTFFCEVENIVNGRPITKLSDDVRDASPLTPNHLLLLKQNSNEALGLSVPNDVHRTRWRHVQFLANVFWSRWTREYLPILQKRSNG